MTIHDVHVDTSVLESIVEDVLLSLGVPAWPVDPEAAPSITTTGNVTVSGAWTGAVLVELPEGMDIALSAAMFALPVEQIGRSEVDDAVGELANMVGGGVKSLMPEPSRLSLPTVVHGERLRLTVPGAELMECIARQTPDGVLRVSVWSGPNPA